ILHTFAGPDGADPASGLVQSQSGVLYGTTQLGGTTGHGTVFALTPPASPGGNWTEAVLHNFTGGSDGAYPNGLVLGPDGVFYGTTGYGGTGTSGHGTVFALMP